MMGQMVPSFFAPIVMSYEINGGDHPDGFLQKYVGAHEDYQDERKARSFVQLTFYVMQIRSIHWNIQKWITEEQR